MHATPLSHGRGPDPMWGDVVYDCYTRHHLVRQGIDLNDAACKFSTHVSGSTVYIENKKMAYENDSSTK